MTTIAEHIQNEIKANAAALLTELQAANQIIRNALNIMTTDQKIAWAVKNAQDGVDGEGETRANERDAVINKAKAHAKN